MADIPPRLGPLTRHIWVGLAKNLTSWVAVGTIIALTGFGPEHWFAAAFRYIDPQAGLGWLAWLDIRAAIVSIGVAIVVADVLVRRMRREKRVITLAGAKTPLPGSDQPRPRDEGPAGDVVAGEPDACIIS